MQAMFARSGPALIPADEDAEKFINRIGQGEIALLEGVKPRNPMYHRKAFAMLRYAFDFWEPPEIEWRGEVAVRDFECFREHVTVLAGYYDVVITLKGEPKLRPKSISYSSMEADEFERWYSAVADVLIRVFLQAKGIDREMLDRHVEHIVRMA